MFVHNSCDYSLTKGFRYKIESAGWAISSTDIYFPDVGDSVADTGTFFLGVHTGTSPEAEAPMVKFPPNVAPLRLASFAYAPFDSVEYAVCLSWRHKDFESEGNKSSEPKHNETQAKRFISKCIRTVHHPGDDVNISSGAEIYDTAGLCPPFSPSNSNAFGSTLGIEFKDKDGQLYIRPFSAYEVTCCFRLDKDITHFLSHA